MQFFKINFANFTLSTCAQSDTTIMSWCLYKKASIKYWLFISKQIFYFLTFSVFASRLYLFFNCKNSVVKFFLKYRKVLWNSGREVLYYVQKQFFPLKMKYRTVFKEMYKNCFFNVKRVRELFLKNVQICFFAAKMQYRTVLKNVKKTVFLL